MVEFYTTAPITRTHPVVQLTPTAIHPHPLGVIFLILSG